MSTMERDVVIRAVLATNLNEGENTFSSKAEMVDRPRRGNHVRSSSQESSQESSQW